MWIVFYTCETLKIAENIIDQPLAEIFNLSTRLGRYPNKLKLAKAIPVNKGEDDSEPGNNMFLAIFKSFAGVEYNP